MDGSRLPKLETSVPGPESARWVNRLADTECPAITARRARRAEAGGVEQDPIVWESAVGANVTDVDGNVFVDLTAAFGVAAIGHRHPRVQAAAAAQSARLIHAMGDVYPGRAKIELAERLAARAPGDLAVSIFAMSGAEAVEAALKTAAVATGRSGVIAFAGGYHGLSYGALEVTGYRDSFKRPFRGQLGRFSTHLPYADCYRCPVGKRYPDCGVACLALIESALDHPANGVDDIGAVIVEPIQGRGGMILPPDEWLNGLVALCRERGVLVIFDEIFTGFGRTGDWFVADRLEEAPDLMCVGKAMAGGFPLSAALGSAQVMAKWGLSSGESLHTSTFLGNPLGCAMGLAAMDALELDGLVERAAEVGESIRARALELMKRHQIIGNVRGRGVMWGLELVEDRESKRPASHAALKIMRDLLARGFLVLPSGVHGNVLGLTPPIVITDDQLGAFFDALDEVLGGV